MRERCARNRSQCELVASWLNRQRFAFVHFLRGGNSRWRGKMLDLRRLRYFVTLADELHFGRAAGKLHVAQPPLTRQISLLETEVGFQLFSRTSRTVLLTDAGRRFLPYAKAVLAHGLRATEFAKSRVGGHHTQPVPERHADMLFDQCKQALRQIGEHGARLGGCLCVFSHDARPITMILRSSQSLRAARDRKGWAKGLSPSRPRGRGAARASAAAFAPVSGWL